MPDSAALATLETPHAVVDLERVRQNLARVHGYAREHGLSLRPHTKTHKDDALGRLQIEAGAIGLTVATAREAEVMARVTRDLLIAYPPVDPARIARLFALPEEVELTFALDSIEAAERLTRAAQERRRRVRVLVELDLGAGRTGVQSSDALVGVTRSLSSEFARFAGVLYHPGQLRGRTLDVAARRAHDQEDAAALDREDVARWERELARLRGDLGRYLERLEREGLSSSIVSGGNTPSLFLSHLVPELTEIRPGTYVYSDRDIASQGVLPFGACAYSVVATVVSTSVPGQAVIDAGTKAIAKEPIAGLPGYGVLLDHPEVHLRALSEEHGLLELGASEYRPRVGERVRVVPNHVCVSVHLQDRIAFLDGDRIEVRDVPARGRA